MLKILPTYGAGPCAYRARVSGLLLPRYNTCNIIIRISVHKHCKCMASKLSKNFISKQHFDSRLRIGALKFPHDAFAIFARKEFRTRGFVGDPLPTLCTWLLGCLLALCVSTHPATTLSRIIRGGIGSSWIFLHGHTE